MANLRLNNVRLQEKDENSRVERVKEAEKKKKVANESMDEAFERIWQTCKWDEKEVQLFELARKAFREGNVGRLSDKRLSKSEVKSMGERVIEGHKKEERERRIKETLENKPDNFYILTDDSQLPSFLSRLRQEVRLQSEQWKDRFDVLGVQSMTAGDYEGTGIDSYIDLSVGFSIWLPILDEGYYLPYGHVPGFDVPYAFQENDKQLTRSKVIESLEPYLSHKDHGKTFHMGSARYDLHIALNDGYEIKGCVWDTLDAMRLMNEHEKSYGLKPLTQKYGKVYGIEGEVFTFEDLFGNRSPAPFNTEIVGIYAIKDVLFGWKLFEWQFEMMAKTNRLLECYAKIDSKIPETDVFMERCGFIVDKDELYSLEKEFTSKIEQAKQKVFDTYKIDDKFVLEMDRTISKTKIKNWMKSQEKKINTLKGRISKKKQKVEELQSKKKTHTKQYENEVEMLRKYKKELSEMSKPTEDNAPRFVESFELTNGNHLAYLIYDHLEIEDKTYKVDYNKKRSTAADVMEMYFEDEPTLEPLADVSAYQKLVGTYIRPMLGIDQDSTLEIDGRLHSNFKAGGTSTGRYSSSQYNGRPTDILDEFKEVSE